MPLNNIKSIYIKNKKTLIIHVTYSFGLCIFTIIFLFMQKNVC